MERIERDQNGRTSLSDLAEAKAVKMNEADLELRCMARPECRCRIGVWTDPVESRSPLDRGLLIGARKCPILVCKEKLCLR